MFLRKNHNNSLKEKELELRKLLDQIEMHGDKLGYRCIAPVFSFWSGHKRFKTGITIIGNSPGCLNTLFKSNALVDKYADKLEDHLDATDKLQKLFEKSHANGSCRFWRKIGDTSQESECKNAAEKLEVARKEAMKTFNLRK